MVRRSVLLLFLAIIVTSGTAKSQPTNKELWLSRFSHPLGTVIGGGPGKGGLMQLLKFRDSWWINTTDYGPEYIPDHPTAIAKGHPTVRVPKQFVTDLASIPREFWSLFAPHEAYARAAVIHDWLYWNQSVPRELADEIFEFSMRDDRINEKTRRLIMTAVRLGGQGAWDKNAKLKRAGEFRVLQVVPRDPTSTWAQWKLVPGVFNPGPELPAPPDPPNFRPAPPFPGAQPPPPPLGAQPER